MSILIMHTKFVGYVVENLVPRDIQRKINVEDKKDCNKLATYE